MGWGLWTSATRAFIRVGYFQSVEVGEELAVPCSQPEDGDLLGSVQLVACWCLSSWWTWSSSGPIGRRCLHVVLN